MNEPRREAFDEEISVRGIVGFGVGLVVVCALALIAVWSLNGFFEDRTERAQSRPAPLAQSAAEYSPPAPRLQRLPEQERQLMSENDDRELHSYRLLDESAGIVQIPIEEAILRIVESGVPQWPRTDTEER